LITPLKGIKTFKCTKCGKPYLSDMEDPGLCSKCDPSCTRAEMVEFLRGKGYHFTDEDLNKIVEELK
jgi:NAD-dependent SIR2 family protein deacetylase